MIVKKWLASLFEQPTVEKPYVIYIRDAEVARSVSENDAEEWLRETFNEVDAGLPSGGGISRRQRWLAFRAQARITKIF